MLGAGKYGCFGWWYSLQTTPSTTPGVSITPGSGSEGSYVQLASGANLTDDVYGIRLWVVAGNTAATIRDIIMDIHLDPAGGTSYASSGGIDNIWVAQAANAVQSGRWFWLPLFIKAGTSVGARAQAINTTTVRAAAWFFGRPQYPQNTPAAQYTETIGVSGNGGTPYTNGNSAAWGSWTSIGTTTRPCWYWILCTGHNVGTTTAQMYFTELSYGDASNKTTIIPCQPHHNTGTSETTGAPNLGTYFEVPSGSTLYVRGSASGTAETTEAVAIGFGG